MKTMNIANTDLAKCLRAAKQGRVVLTRKGKPVALVVGINGMDLEQVEMTQTPEFWAMIRERRAQKKITPTELERWLGKNE